MENKKREQQLKKLSDNKHYYGKFGKQFLSNSDVYTLLYEEEQYGCKRKETDKMLKGRYFHTLVLEPKLKDTFLIAPCPTRRQKVYTEFINENGLEIALTQSEAEAVEEQVEWFLSKDNEKLHNNMIADRSIADFIHDKKALKEQPGIEEIDGIEFKGKADMISNDIILDFKTTENVRRFPQAVKYDSSYDTQAYIYQQIFKLPFVFVVVGNTQKKYADGTKYYEIGIHAATDEVILRGKIKTMEEIKRYKAHMDGTRNVKQFIYNTILT